MKDSIAMKEQCLEPKKYALKAIFVQREVSTHLHAQRAHIIQRGEESVSEIVQFAQGAHIVVIQVYHR